MKNRFMGTKIVKNGRNEKGILVFISILSYLCGVKQLLVFLMLAIGCQMHAQSWGNQGDGTYRNPVLPADLSDPDVVRVGEKYYMVASDFHFLGMQILESENLMDWRVVAQLYSRFDYSGWDTMEHYAGGSWAPSIRWHDGRLWVYFCTPDEGLFMTTAEKAEGPWSQLRLVKAVEKWEDPCPFWDEDGRAYLAHSRYGAGPIILHRMSDDGTRLLDEGETIYYGPVAEGPKIQKRDGYYYISIPEGGVRDGWQTMLRSRNIYGPYERRIVLEQGSTEVNGPHQGAIVDTPDGNWWFFHFQEWSPLGRIVHLQPMRWKDGWPEIGMDYNGNGVGEPVASWTLPYADRQHDTGNIVWSDDFCSGTLDPHWQWNHNPDNSAWSLNEQKGKLSLRALEADGFAQARNTLTLRTMGYQGCAEVTLDAQEIADGMSCGLGCMGKQNHQIGVRKEGADIMLFVACDDEKETGISMRGTSVRLRLLMDAMKNEYRFEYSFDGRPFAPLGQHFAMRWGNWKGARIALFSYNQKRSKGVALFDDFCYEINRSE